MRFFILFSLVFLHADGRELKIAQSGRCMTSYSGDVTMRNCNGSPFQDWTILDDSKIRNGGCNSCLYYDNGPANARITLQPCYLNYGDGMRWTLVDGVLRNLRYNWCARPNTAANSGVCMGTCYPDYAPQNWGKDHKEQEKVTEKPTEKPVEIVFP